jgi:hypothetical protein
MVIAIKYKLTTRNQSIINKASTVVEDLME